MVDPRIEEAIANGRVPPDITVDDLQENRDAPAIASITTIAVLTSLVVMCRLYSRKYITKKCGFGLDDAIAVASLLAFIAFVALAIELIRLGGGRPFPFLYYVVDEVIEEQIEVMDSIVHLLYSTALVLCRISGIAFYYRVCSMHKTFRLAIKIVFVLIILGYVAQMCIIIFHCKPITLMWSPFEEDGDYECLYWFEMYTIISSISLFCDLVLFGIPAAMLKGLELSRKQKLQLACVLLPGILVIAISGARVVLVSLFNIETDENFYYAMIKLLCVETSEIGATIMAVSIPGVKPMVDKYILRKNKGSRSTGTSISSEKAAKQHRSQSPTVEYLEEKVAE